MNGSAERVINALEKGRWTGTTEFKLVSPEEANDEEEDPVLRAAQVESQRMEQENSAPVDRSTSEVELRFPQGPGTSSSTSQR